jgi:hypothetical protein
MAQPLISSGAYNGLQGKSFPASSVAPQGQPMSKLIVEYASESFKWLEN